VNTLFHNQAATMHASQDDGSLPKKQACRVPDMQRRIERILASPINRISCFNRTIDHGMDHVDFVHVAEQSINGRSRAILAPATSSGVAFELLSFDFHRSV